MNHDLCCEGEGMYCNCIGRCVVPGADGWEAPTGLPKLTVNPTILRIDRDVDYAPTHFRLDATRLHTLMLAIPGLEPEPQRVVEIVAGRGAAIVCTAADAAPPEEAADWGQTCSWTLDGPDDQASLIWVIPNEPMGIEGPNPVTIAVRLVVGDHLVEANASLIITDELPSEPPILDGVYEGRITLVWEENVHVNPAVPLPDEYHSPATLGLYAPQEVSFLVEVQAYAGGGYTGPSVRMDLLPEDEGGKTVLGSAFPVQFLADIETLGGKKDADTVDPDGPALMKVDYTEANLGEPGFCGSIRRSAVEAPHHIQWDSCANRLSGTFGVRTETLGEGDDVLLARVQRFQFQLIRKDAFDESLRPAIFDDVDESCRGWKPSLEAPPRSILTYIGLPLDELVAIAAGGSLLSCIDSVSSDRSTFSVGCERAFAAEAGAFGMTPAQFCGVLLDKVGEDHFDVTPPFDFGIVEHLYVPCKVGGGLALGCGASCSNEFAVTLIDDEDVAREYHLCRYAEEDMDPAVSASTDFESWIVERAVRCAYRFETADPEDPLATEAEVGLGSSVESSGHLKLMAGGSQHLPRRGAPGVDAITDPSHSTPAAIGAGECARDIASYLDVIRRSPEPIGTVQGLSAYLRDYLSGGCVAPGRLRGELGWLAKVAGLDELGDRLFLSTVERWSASGALAIASSTLETMMSSFLGGSQSSTQPVLLTKLSSEDAKSYASILMSPDLIAALDQVPVPVLTSPDYVSLLAASAETQLFGHAGDAIAAMAASLAGADEAERESDLIDRAMALAGLAKAKGKGVKQSFVSDGLKSLNRSLGKKTGDHDHVAAFKHGVAVPLKAWELDPPNDFESPQAECPTVAQGDMEPFSEWAPAVPIYFADPQGTNARFFATSEYLLNNFARPALESSAHAVEKAKDEWGRHLEQSVALAGSTVDLNEERAAMERRYGERLSSLCGLESDARESFAALTGEPLPTPEMGADLEEWLGNACWFNPSRKLVYPDDYTVTESDPNTCMDVFHSIMLAVNTGANGESCDSEWNLNYTINARTALCTAAAMHAQRNLPQNWYDIELGRRCTDREPEPDCLDGTGSCDELDGSLGLCPAPNAIPQHITIAGQDPESFAGENEVSDIVGYAWRGRYRFPTIDWAEMAYGESTSDVSKVILGLSTELVDNYAALDVSLGENSPSTSTISDLSKIEFKASVTFSRSSWGDGWFRQGGFLDVVDPSYFWKRGEASPVLSSGPDSFGSVSPEQRFLVAFETMFGLSDRPTKGDTVEPRQRRNRAPSIKINLAKLHSIRLYCNGKLSMGGVDYAVGSGPKESWFAGVGLTEALPCLWPGALESETELGAAILPINDLIFDNEDGLGLKPKLVAALGGEHQFDKPVPLLCPSALTGAESCENGYVLKPWAVDPEDGGDPEKDATDPERYSREPKYCPAYLQAVGALSLYESCHRAVWEYEQLHPTPFYPLKSPHMPAEISTVAPCFRGELGALMIRVFEGYAQLQRAQETVILLSNTQAAQAGYCNYMTKNHEKQRSISARIRELSREQAKWGGILSALASAVVQATTSAVAAYASGGGSIALNTTTQATGAVAGGGAALGAAFLSLDYQEQIDAQQALLEETEHELQETGCWLESSKISMQVEDQTRAGILAYLSAISALVEFSNRGREYNTTVLTARADKAAMTTRHAAKFALGAHVINTVYSPQVLAAQEDAVRGLRWAARMLALTRRALEHEAQANFTVPPGLEKLDSFMTSLLDPNNVPKPEDVRDSLTPGLLSEYLRFIEAEIATRRVNGARPEARNAVLSLRDEVLEVVDFQEDEFHCTGGESCYQCGGLDVTSAGRFSERILDASNALFDERGQYLGQAVRFSLKPEGELKYRCAERLWGIGASIEGDLLSADGKPRLPLFVLKLNTFHSQACGANDYASDYPEMKSSTWQPLDNPFRLVHGGAVLPADSTYSWAHVDAWLNVKRGDLYSDQYAQGGSEELAGRGLYGDYMLLVPWWGFLDEHRDLVRGIDDIYLRFEYLSVADGSGSVGSTTPSNAPSGEELRRKAGEPCYQNTQCESSRCVGLVCCEGACPDACASCGLPGLEGTCVSLPAGAVAQGGCNGFKYCESIGTCDVLCEEDEECLDDHFCNSSGDCQQKVQLGAPCWTNSECFSGHCPGTIGSTPGVCCDTSCDGTCEVCSEAGQCQHDSGGVDSACEQYLCLAVPPSGEQGPCEVECETNSQCIDSAYCDSLGHCEPDVANGTECEVSGDCVSGHCFGATESTPGVCCNAACDGTCEECSEEGQCEHDAGGVDSECGNYLCRALPPSGEEGPCEVECDSNDDCVTAAYCDAGGACVTDAANGTACDEAGDCSSGFCVDGRCCGVASCGTCEICGDAGTCTDVSAGSDPKSDCTSSSASTCGLDGYCDGTGACRLWSNATECASASCIDAMLTEAQECDGVGGACPTGTPAECPGHLKCASATACLTSCSGHGDCVSGYYCNSGACSPLIATGDACTLDNDASCESGHCEDGYCCNVDTCGDESTCGESCGIDGFEGTCTFPEDTTSCGTCQRCDGEGTCDPVADGLDPDSQCTASSETTCGLDGSCNGSGACRQWSSSTQCAPPSCTSGSLTPARSCDGAGSCATAGSPTTCGSNYACESSTACGTTCSLDAHCQSAYYCDPTACVAKGGTGVACSANNQCLSNVCTSSLCE